MMTISATETTLTLTGHESPVASISIDGDLVDFTAYDGTLASTTSGTPFTLSLSGFTDQDAAFYGQSVEPDINMTIYYSRSGKAKWADPMQVGKQNSVSLDISSWLDEGDFISGISVTADDFTIEDTGFTDTTITVKLEGVESGRFPVHFSWDTDAGESGCMTGYLDVLSC